MTSAQPNPLGHFFWIRPMADTYTPEIAAKVCAAIAAGEPGKNSLRAVCKLPGMPSRATVYRWLDEHREFEEMYAKATTRRADGYMDEIVEIADDASQTKAGVAKAKLRIYAREKYAAKIAPRKYGERVTQEHVGADGGPIQHRLHKMTDEELDAEIAKRAAALSNDEQQG